jgi:hypothetical protein
MYIFKGLPNGTLYSVRTQMIFKICCFFFNANKKLKFCLRIYRFISFISKHYNLHILSFLSVILHAGDFDLEISVKNCTPMTPNHIQTAGRKFYM